MWSFSFEKQVAAEYLFTEIILYMVNTLNVTLRSVIPVVLVKTCPCIIVSLH